MRERWRRAARDGIAVLLIAALTACGETGAGEADAEPRAPWAFSYSGALSGEISGGVTVVRMLTTGMNRVTMTGRGHGTDARFTGSYQFPSDHEPLGEKRMLSFNLVLADGTRCQPRLDQDQAVFARVIDATEESYSAEFSGTIGCDNGSPIDVTGYFRE